MVTDKDQVPSHDLSVEKGSYSIQHLNDVSLQDKALNNGALAATVNEHSTGLWQSLKTHKRAALWSIRK